MLFNFVVVEEKGRWSSCVVGGAKADDDEVIEHKRRANAANCTGEGGGNDSNLRIMVEEAVLLLEVEQKKCANFLLN